MAFPGGWIFDRSAVCSGELPPTSAEHMAALKDLAEWSKPRYRRPLLRKIPGRGWDCRASPFTMGMLSRGAYDFLSVAGSGDTPGEAYAEWHGKIAAALQRGYR